MRSADMSKPRRKSHRWYLFFRVYTLVVIVGWLVLGLGSAIEQAFPLYPLVSMPFFVSALWMLSSLAAFPFAYSVFGPYERTPFPDEKPLLVRETFRGSVGLKLGGGMLAYVWSVYPSGLGIHARWCGKVFIPVGRIRSVKPDTALFQMMTGYKLIHDSPDVRNPIGIPSTRVVKDIQRLLTKKRETSEQGANGP